MQTIEALQAELAHWKSNHANLAQRCQYLAQRLDLPVDRIPAYLAHVEEIKTLALALRFSDALRAKLQAENAALRAEPSPLFTPKSLWEANIAYERQAFAQGLHLAARGAIPIFTEIGKQA
ncbi:MULTISPECIES: hypothetical protein [unclassified Janthinobacterium]|uniref:hypothetical protein n=1 Tax=unclassified Janthinobacterium TaxID=2610881 RepID=UPI000374F5FF|nr:MULTISPECIES: hypothetical protein [unclassified Janthinobacterium]MEC5161692.1 hypothetical protein [Janthinobacterium sp. CG_S6]